MLMLTGCVKNETRVGYYSPIWGNDGRYIYYVQRETTGTIIGLGRELLTPAARVYVEADRFSLRRLDTQTSATEKLADLGPSPLQGAHYRGWHGRIFSTAFVRLTAIANGTAIAVQLMDPRADTSRLWALEQRWPGNVGTWRSEPQSKLGLGSPSVEVLNGNQELITLPDHEGYRGAIVILETGKKPRALLTSQAFERDYMGRLPGSMIAAESHRPEILRLWRLAKEEPRLREEFQRKGLSEGDAILRANDILEQKGLLLPGPKLIAERVHSAPNGLAVFHISRQLFATGLFPDIEKAIGRPGTQINQGIGSYVGYAGDHTSEALNAYLGSGAQQFLVDRDGELWLITIRTATRPS